MLTKNKSSYLVALIASSPAFFGAACMTESEDATAFHESGDDATASFNGLSSINGLSSLNGLSSINGLSSLNGLASVNGLANGVGLMTSTGGRSTVSYLVRCALPAGRSITKRDQNGVSYTYAGQLGLAPQWETGSCDNNCQEYISACLLAHVNTSGKNVKLWMDGDHPNMGWGRSTDYPYQEGSFFGNIFASPPKAYFCNGKDFDQGAVPGRLGVGTSGAPYTNPFGNGAYCKDRCTAADYPNGADGYKACNGFNHVITVWRNFDPNTNYKVCNRRSGLCLDVDHKSTADGASLIQWGYTGGDNQKWRIKQVSPGRYTFQNFFSGKMLDINGGSTGNGASLIQWTPNGGTNQQWSFTPTGDGFYKFSPVSQINGSIELPDGTTTAGAKVQQWSWTGTSWQQWSIQPLSN